MSSDQIFHKFCVTPQENKKSSL